MASAATIDHMLLLKGTPEYYVITFKQEHLHSTLRMFTCMGCKVTLHYSVYLNNKNGPYTYSKLSCDVTGMLSYLLWL